MILVSFVLLAIVVFGALSSFHLGSHVLFASGVIGAVASLVLLADVVFLANVASMVLTIIVLAGILIFCIALAVMGMSGVMGARRVVDPKSSASKLLQAEGVAVTDLTPQGTVRVLGETWTAESLSGSVKAGVDVYVAEIDGIRLKVWANPEHSRNLEQGSKA